MVLGYLCANAAQRSLVRTGRLLLPGLLMLLFVAGVYQLANLFARSKARLAYDPAAGLVRYAVVAAFLVTSVVFFRFAVSTEARLARDGPPRFPHHYSGPFNISETVASYREYRSIEGFEDKKAKLLRFLNLHGVSP
jgi:hypothetical protein